MSIICFCAPIVFLTALGMILQEVLNVQGFQTARAVSGAIKDRLLLLPERFYSDKLLSEFEISGDRIFILSF